MRDFLGKTIKSGDYVTRPGSGNKTAEYGLILYRVLDVTPKGIVAERISVEFEADEYIYIHKTSTLKKSTALTVVNPPQHMIDVFNDPEGNDKITSAWLHGRTEIAW